MMVLVTYDVATDTPEGRRRLRRVAKACENWGQRVQYSVFECELDPAQWTALRARLMALIDPTTDSLRFYQLGSNWQRRVEHIGAKPALDMGGPLIF
ncbi:CRISPR-associated endonuclease Cas2 [Pararhodobacter oceanensis]|uniref:CRISPR-associated endonuclease Cas2 n=1 Tax=Pararhodobacter oceanensis TaxID=2172121 RepID=UPI003A948F5A